MRCGRKLLSAGLLLFCCLCFFDLSFAQQTSANPLAFAPVTLPKVFVNARFQFQLHAQGGSQPYQWRVASGDLPAGIKLSRSGSLEGTPTATGEFHFIVTVTDNEHPAADVSQPLTMKVTAPLIARWDRYPKINGQRIEGSVKVSNDTEYDFDLTFIVLAINEIGRAEAIGYQRFTLRKNTTDFVLPFGENVPTGSYQVHADVVGEVAAIHSIHRARLDTKARLVLQQGP
ncbi:MAG TPA: putative Ig domain-containing protein [Terriglobales bacterium]